MALPPVYKVIALAGRRGAGKTTLAQFALRNSKELFGNSFTVGITGFAFAMKEYLNTALGVPRDILYGPDEIKNRLTHLSWSDWPGGPPHHYGYMTGREVMEEWARIVLRLDPDAGVRPCLAHIAANPQTIWIIEDLRRQWEIEALHNVGGKVIRLSRRIDDDKTTFTDSCFDNLTGWDASIDNANMTLADTQATFAKLLHRLLIMEPARHDKACS